MLCNIEVYISIYIYIYIFIAAIFRYCKINGKSTDRILSKQKHMWTSKPPGWYSSNFHAHSREGRQSRCSGRQGSGKHFRKQCEDVRWNNTEARANPRRRHGGVTGLTPQCHPNAIPVVPGSSPDNHQAPNRVPFPIAVWGRHCPVRLVLPGVETQTSCSLEGVSEPLGNTSPPRRRHATGRYYAHVVWKGWTHKIAC